MCTVFQTAKDRSDFIPEPPFLGVASGSRQVVVHPVFDKTPSASEASALCLLIWCGLGDIFKSVHIQL